MVHLTPTGLSEDGRRLLLLSDAGVEFTVDVDARLRAALRGDHARLGQLEITMDSTLRPRDIQARIRAGETPEAVAQAAQTTADAIMPYAAPVLAERAHVAQRAQKASVRRRAGDGTGNAGARNLGDAVGAYLRSLNVDPGIVTWDSWRREDGRWTLTGDYSHRERSGSAQFTFDAPGNYVVAENADARWLIGELVAPAAKADQASAPRDELRTRRRRLAAVPPEELPLGADAIDLVHEDDSLGAEHDLDGYLDDTATSMPAVEDPVAEEPVAEEAAAEPTEAETEPVAEDEAAKPAKTRRKGRSSVPSWDEIMFGGGSGKE
ncbi:MAG: septation protein SepH [Nocardioides sp.]